MGDSFVHLHVHTEYSMLDGAARLGDLFTEASRLGMPALAMTDHGNTFGAYEFYHHAVKAGVKPIIGMEAYLTPGTHRSQRTRVRWAEGGENDVSGGGAYTHLTLLAENAEGLHNLFRLASLASIEGFFYKPRIDRELLHRYAAGIIGTTGCPSGEVQTWLRIGDYAKAREAAAEFQDIFGKDNYYLELMDHGLDIERRVRDDLLRLKDDLGLAPVASNDLHYTFAGDSRAQEVLLCVQSGKTLADPNRFKFDAHDFYLKTAEEMRELWDREVPGACDATLEIAERVGSYDEVFAPRDLMPRVAVPEGESEESWLRAEVDRGLQRRFGGEVSERYREQARHEIDVIAQKGYPGYFLVVADLCRYAKEAGIRVGPGRGSAAGALIAYALGITELDPLEHGLIFERFLNPERESMPDIDLDFDERRRSDMIRYTTEKYGDDHVAQIITYGTIKAKAAIKDAARVLGLPFALSDRITKAMPPAVMGKEISLAGIFDPAHPRHGEAAEFRQLYESDEEIKQAVDTARGLEGLKRQWGVHAAGVILSHEPLLDVIPIQKREQDGAIITQFDMGACESVGLLKMDFLGLRNLTVLDDALQHIEANRGTRLDLEMLDLEDKATYELLSRGDTLGVFQLDGGPMRSLLRQLKPDSFKDISAVLALYRPGPMGANSHVNYAERKNGRQQVQAIHPELAGPLDDILGETYGLIVFQEQVMAIAQRVADYSLGQADLLRRAMGKKKKEVLDKEFVPFSEGMRAKGYSEDAITTLWEILVPFSDYAFNRSHTAGYGLVSYWTAFLKANYPAEYMSALLTSVRDDKDKSALYLSECRRMGIRVYPPDVNESEEDFTPRGDDILFGLGAVRNVGSNVVQSILRTRKSSGRFVDFADFLQKVEAVVCNKRTIESLIKAGAFDSLGHTRRGLCEQHETAVDAVIGVKREEAKGQFDLFGGGLDDAGPTTAFGLDLHFSSEEWKKSVLLSFEREMLGLYVSSHPLLGFEHVLAARTDCPIAALSTDRADGDTVAVGGIVSAVQRKLSKKGNAFAIVTIEDLDSSVDVMFFSSAYELYATELEEDAVVVVRARLDKREDSPRLVASDLTVLDINEESANVPIRVAMQTSKATQPLVAELKEVLKTHPGTTEVQLKLQGTTNTMVIRIDDGLRVNPTPALMGDLKALLGPSCLE